MIDYKRILFIFLLLPISFNNIADPVELNLASCSVSKAAYVNDLANAYQQKTGIQINVHAGNSTTAIRDVHNGVVDIGGTSRYLIPNELRESDVELLPVAWDALTIIVHKDNPLENISLEQVKAIYTGKIRYWSELGGADQKIEVYAHKNKISGNGHTLRELLFSNELKPYLAKTIENELQVMAEEGILTFDSEKLEVSDLGMTFLRNICKLFDNRLRNAKSGDSNMFSKAI